MRPFAYERANDVDDAVARGRARRRFLAGGTNLVDLMRLGSRGRTCSSTSARCRSTGSRSAGRRCCASARGAQQRPRRRHARARRYPVLASARRPAPRAQLATSPPRRQPAAAHPLRVLPGRLDAVQQARAAARAAPRSRLDAPPCDPGGSDHCVAIHPSDMAVAMTSRRRRRGDGVGRRTPNRRGRPAPAPRRRTRRRHGARPRRLIITDRNPAATTRRPVSKLPQGPRPRVVRVRAGLGRRRDRRRRRHVLAVRVALGGVAPTALARRPGERPAGRTRRPTTECRGGRRRAGRPRFRCQTTSFKVPSDPKDRCPSVLRRADAEAQS